VGGGVNGRLRFVCFSPCISTIGGSLAMPALPAMAALPAKGALMSLLAKPSALAPALPGRAFRRHLVGLPKGDCGGVDPALLQLPIAYLARLRLEFVVV